MMKQYLILRIAIGFCFLNICVGAFAQRTVLSTPPTIVDRFPKKSGALRATTFSFSIGEVKGNERKSDTLWLYNEGDSPMDVKVVGPSDNPFALPKDLSFQPVHQYIPARKEAYIVISVDGRLATETGFRIQHVRLLTDDRPQQLKNLAVSSNIREFFPAMTAEDSAMVQKVRVASTNFDLGVLKSGEKGSARLYVCNDGKRDLQIRKFISPSRELYATFASTTVHSADSTLMTIVFDTKGRVPGRLNQSLSLFVNDPTLPEIVFSITGEVR